LSDCIVHVVVTYIVPPLYIVLSVFYSKLFFFCPNMLYDTFCQN